MRRAASSRPSRCGMDTISGFDMAVTRSRCVRLNMGSARTDGSSSRPPQRHCGALGTVQNPAQRAGTAFGDRAHAEIATGAIRQQSTRSAPMRLKTRLHLSVAAIGVAGLLALAPAQLRAQTAVAIDADAIGGDVTGPRGPETSVWVIAETTDLPTRYAKMVVTDDQGRYVVPDLPKAKYKVWVRGYGLVDSPKVDGEPGKQVNLTAVAAPNDAEAAKYYPAIYWYSMLKIPDAGQFGKKDGDIPDKVKQTDWLNLMKNNGCVGCNQMGQLSTRTFPPGLGEFASHSEAWVKRTQAGQSGALMVNILAGQLAGSPIKYFADWTERVAKGELPKNKPPRPQGVERNIVVTTWDWGDPKKYLHDLIASDRRYPTVNAYGPVFGQPE